MFKREGATFIAHNDTAGMMKMHYGLEQKRRQGYFKQRQFDPQEVKLVLPDVTFDSNLTLNLGGRTVELLYMGAGQNPGDTFVRFPKEKVLFAGGPFSKNSWPNPSFTPSMTVTPSMTFTPSLTKTPSSTKAATVTKTRTPTKKGKPTSTPRR